MAEYYVKAKGKEILSTTNIKEARKCVIKWQMDHNYPGNHNDIYILHGPWFVTLDAYHLLYLPTHQVWLQYDAYGFANPVNPVTGLMDKKKTLNIQKFLKWGN